MKLFGRELSFGKKQLSPPPARAYAWAPVIKEPWAGAWQRNMEERRADLLTYPTLYACITMISQDIAKLPFLLMRRDGDLWLPDSRAAYDPVLRGPNYYQTAAQFRESWVLAKLLHGNAYILKQRDARGVVTSLYPLDPLRVQPLIAESGDIFYRLHTTLTSDLPPLPDNIYQRVDGTLVVPEAEIIHDRMATFHHPLIGVPPVAAANWPAVKNLKILKSSAQFFSNGASPGGILTAPAGMTDDDAKALKGYWDENFAGEQSGKVAVIGADMKFTALAFKAADSQLVEQMRYSDEQIAQCFKVKPYKIGISAPPSGWKSDDINVEYHDSALSPLIEAMEDLMVAGLGISPPLRVQLDIQTLWRMDMGKKAEVVSRLVGSKVMTPNEGRAQFNYAPTGGGDSLWGQHQDYPLSMLEERNDLESINDAPEPEPSEEDDEEEAEREERNYQKAIDAMREAANV